MRNNKAHIFSTIALIVVIAVLFINVRNEINNQIDPLQVRVDGINDQVTLASEQIQGLTMNLGSTNQSIQSTLTTLSTSVNDQVASVKASLDLINITTLFDQASSLASTLQVQNNTMTQLTNSIVYYTSQFTAVQNYGSLSDQIQRLNTSVSKIGTYQECDNSTLIASPKTGAVQQICSLTLGPGQWQLSGVTWFSGYWQNIIVNTAIVANSPETVSTSWNNGNQLWTSNVYVSGLTAPTSYHAVLSETTVFYLTGYSIYSTGNDVYLSGRLSAFQLS